MEVIAEKLIHDVLYAGTPGMLTPTNKLTSLEPILLLHNFQFQQLTSSILVVQRQENHSVTSAFRYFLSPTDLVLRCGQNVCGYPSDEVCSTRP
ncbi:hypothetical protein SK128_007279 [Halocaridina rubra]|uniref:Uncharacterized protein n=1 Tax=Halocaridina rubra TaxID=373956 RepID=A0AAN8WKQ8_HALRR